MIFHTLKLKVTNVYLVRAGHSYLLVDTGYEYEWDLFRRRLREAGVGLAEIGFILPTHHHDDHAGLLDTIVRENPGARVILPRTGKPLLESGRNFHEPGAGYINRRISLLLSMKGKLDRKWTHTFPPYRVRPNDILISGDVRFRDLGVDLDGGILETPGHSPDHLSILFDDGDCIAGDAAANFLQWAGAKHCVISVDDLDQYYAGWEKLLSGNARRIFPGHGMPFGAAALRRNLGRQKKDHMVLFKQPHSWRSE
jgi:glyoxylase-like metal-dependent hydrolase (beta-lactamase superfamily II)